MGTSDEIRNILDNWNWTKYIPRLIKFALSVLRQKVWYGERGGDVATGKMAKDFVLDAIEKVYSGQRKWDKGKCPDLYQFLCGVIRSDLSNASKSVENKATKLSGFEEEDAPEESSEVLVKREVREFAKQVSRAKSPLENLVVVEDQKESEEYLLGFMEFIDGDEELKSMYGCIIDGAATPKDIAKMLNIDVMEVYNRKKRMRRKLEEYNNGSRPTRIPVAKGGKSYAK